MTETRRHYDAQFRERAVRAALASGEPATRTARRLGVHPATLAGWIARERARQDRRAGLSRDDQEELRRLRAEVVALRMERDVLKRSVACWTEEDATQRRWHASSHPSGLTTECHTPSPAERWG